MKYLITTQSWLIISLTVLTASSIATAASADTGATILTQVINPGLLTLAPSTRADLGAVTLNHSQSQVSTGSTGPIIVDDSRGNAAGWAVTATIGNLSSYDNFTNSDGDPSPFTVTGTYTGSGNSNISLSLGSGANGTRLGSMTYNMGGAGATGSGTLQASQPLGTTGLTLNAADIDYPRWGVYQLHISTITANHFSITPSPITTLSGSELNVIAGDRYTLKGKDDPVMIATAVRGYGDGYFQLGAQLNLTIPAGTRPGTYSGQIIETIY